jgi:hypothetical protein
MTSDRYVSTQAIREAVKGRETEVLEALGIAWADGAPHISCPYPDHSDEDPSWRWNERRARAYCTCIEGSQSIFDVVMRVEGIDFEAAKLRVAEAARIWSRSETVSLTSGWMQPACSDRRQISATRDWCGATSLIGSMWPRTRCRCPQPQ